MEQGWIKLHRKLLDNPISNKPLWGWLWVVLLLRANHADKEIIWNGEKKIIHAGSFITGRKVLASESGLTESSVERILNYLEDSKQIEQQKTNKYRLIIILKWHQYQVIEQQMDNKKTTDGQQKDTNNKRKNEKNEKNPDSNADVAKLIKVFESVNPATKRMYGNKTERTSAENLIKQFGIEKTLKGAEAAVACLGQPYAPRITTPYKLETKWAELVAFYQEHKNKQVQKGGIVL